MQPTRSDAAYDDQSLMIVSRALLSPSMQTWKSLTPVEPSNETVTALAARHVAAISTVGTLCALARSEGRSIAAAAMMQAAKSLRGNNHHTLVFPRRIAIRVVAGASPEVHALNAN